MPKISIQERRLKCGDTTFKIITLGVPQLEDCIIFVDKNTEDSIKSIVKANNQFY